LVRPQFAIPFITRGCTRRCPWCIVPQKEGEIRHYNDLEDFTPDGVDKVILLDNNFLAWDGSSDYMREVMIPCGKKFSMTQGFDMRLLNDENWPLMKKINWYNSSLDWKTREIVFGFDEYSMKEIVREKLEMMKRSGYSTSNTKFLLLYDYNTTLSQDLERLHVLNQYTAQGFWMRYRSINGTPKPEVKGYVDCKITDFPKNIFRVRGARRNVRSFLAYLTEKGVQIPREYIRRDMTRDVEKKQHRLEVRLAMNKLMDSLEFN